MGKKTKVGGENVQISHRRISVLVKNKERIFIYH